MDKFKPLGLVFLGCVLFTSFGQAAMIPNLKQNIQLTAREQPIEVFLQQFFGQLDLPVSVDPAVTGIVNASFDAPAQQVLRDIRRSFALVTYHDGAVVHVSRASDIKRRILAVAPGVAERVVRSAKDMRLTDESNALYKTSNGSLSVTGVGRFIALVDELLNSARNAQSAQPPLGFKVFYLRYAWAQDVTINAAGRQTLIPGVASILRSLFSPLSRSNTQYISQNRLLSRRQPKLRGQGLANIGNQERLGIIDDDRRSNQFDRVPTTDDLNLNGSNLIPDYEQALTLSSANQVRIEADPRLNAVIVRDTSERMPYYQNLIDSLDVEPQSLEIEATIIDIDTNRLKELGINWRWNINDKEALFGLGDSSDLRLVPGVQTTPTRRGGAISLILGDGGNFVARINALEAQGVAKIVSRPQVLTLSNVEATFDISSTAYVRVAGEREVDLFNISAGTTLRVTPHVFKHEDKVTIKLLVAVEDGKLSQQLVDNIPIVERSAINTQALIQAGESLLIGGMVREVKEESVNKVPVLGSIPLLGALFRSKRTRTSRIERMFLISPRLTPVRGSSVSTVSKNEVFEKILPNQVADDIVDHQTRVQGRQTSTESKNKDFEKVLPNQIADDIVDHQTRVQGRQASTGSKNKAFDKFSSDNIVDNQNENRQRKYNWD